MEVTKFRNSKQVNVVFRSLQRFAVVVCCRPVGCRHFMCVSLRTTVLHGSWTTRGHANSRIANSRTEQVADWTTRGLADAAKRTKTKHVKSPVASASCPLTSYTSQRRIFLIILPLILHTIIHHRSLLAGRWL